MRGNGHTRRLATIAFLAMGSLAPALAQEAPLPRAEPQRLGFAPERLARIGDALRREVDGNRIPGAVIAIARRGQLAYFETVGFRDNDAKAPMTRDAVFAIASMTKPMASVAAMILYEEGRLALNDPVGKYLPQLARMKVGVLKPDAYAKATSVEAVEAKRQPTIQDLLRHTSGIPYGANTEDEVHKLWPASSSTAARTLSGQEFLDRIGTLPLVTEPGTVWEYSLSVDVLGLVVEKISGKSLGQFLEERLWRPLGMRDTSFALSEATKGRFAKPLPNDPETGKPSLVLHADGAPIKFDCGGGCALSTASD
jgi:CubicO group peptidase (beta-lactamase class C family)